MPADSDTERNVLAALHRFNLAVAGRDLTGVLALFAKDDDVVLVGSEAGGPALGPAAVEEFFRRIFDRPVHYSWRWHKVSVSAADKVAWVLADGEVLLRGGDEDSRQRPYRITGVLKCTGGVWRWQQFHGSEPTGT
jgi:ketosteroid isomerase-like protein